MRSRTWRGTRWRSFRPVRCRKSSARKRDDCRRPSGCGRSRHIPTDPRVCRRRWSLIDSPSKSPPGNRTQAHPRPRMLPPAGNTNGIESCSTHALWRSEQYVSRSHCPSVDGRLVEKCSTPACLGRTSFDHSAETECPEWLGLGIQTSLSCTRPLHLHAQRPRTGFAETRPTFSGSSRAAGIRTSRQPGPTEHRTTAAPRHRGSCHPPGYPHAFLLRLCLPSRWYSESSRAR